MKHNVKQVEEDKTYNGWTNHATWVVSLWLNNTLNAYEPFMAILNDTTVTVTDKAEAVHKLVRRQVSVEQSLQQNSRGTYWGVGIRDDLYKNENLSQVNWIEVVKDNMQVQ